MQYQHPQQLPIHYQQQALFRSSYPALPNTSFSPSTPSKSASDSMSNYLDDPFVLTPLFVDDREAYSYPLSHATPQLAIDTHGDSSPQSSWEDSPLTVYKMSPRTEVGDADMEAVYDSDDDDLVVRGGARSHRPSPPEDKEQPQSVIPPFTGRLPTPPVAYSLGDLTNKEQQSVDPSQMRLFTSRLQEDIKTASLFSAIPTTTFASLNPLPTSNFQTVSVMAAALPHPGQANATDVTSRDIITPLVRKPSMHLQRPAQPINPFQRPIMRTPSPIRPYPAPMIDRAHLRRFRHEPTIQQTLTLKDLVLPNAEFRFGFDPEVMAAELTSPPNRDLDHLVEEYDEDTDVEDFAVAVEPQHVAEVEESTPSRVTRSGRSTSPVVTRAGTKRPRVLFPEPEEQEQQDDDDDEYEDDEDAIGEDEDEDYKASSSTRAAVAAASEPPAKRARIAVGGGAASSIVTRHAPSPDVYEHAVYDSPQATAASRPRTGKARTRHLQPGLVRANGCLHGCELTFSTAYEARRHQEDFHGREEAYHLISQQNLHPNEPVYPRDYRFVIQIGLSHNVGVDKWDSKTKTAFGSASLPSHENSAMSKTLVTALLDFAQEWTKRYECSMCGTSFSRLDSKKRHFAKQCTPTTAVKQRGGL